MTTERTQSKFRFDINGLRALAVIAVMLFHFGVPGFEGGFVGVDVFFTISGFLMTAIIIKGLEKTGDNKEFSVWDYYFNRATRILPALIVLCATLLTISWFTLASTDYKNLAATEIFSLSFLSNISLWREAGYFDVASHEKWLLHTWSLSVEWQFYLILPLILLLIWHFSPGRRSASYALFIALVLSLLISIAESYTSPSAAFYLLPTRSWEMLAGGITYLLAAKLTLVRQNQKLSTWLGLALILISVLLMRSSMPWPGYLALLPVTGTMLVLLADNQTSRFINNQTLQSIGLWSYSIYLWHWPLAVALVYLDLEKQPLAVVCCLILSIAVGWLSYKLVEDPARRNLNKLKQFGTFAALSAPILIIGMAALYIQMNNGSPDRMPSSVEIAAQETLDFNNRRADCHSWSGDKFHSCVFGGPNIKAILIGDSHANSIVTAIQAALPSEKDGVLAFSYTSCPTLFDVNIGNQILRCKEFNKWAIEKIQQEPIEIPLFIVNRISSYAFGSHKASDQGFNKPEIFFDKKQDKPSPEFLTEFREHLVTSICRFALERPVYVVRPIPEMPMDVPKTMSRGLISGHKKTISLTLEKYHQRHAFAWSGQDEASTRCGAITLDPLPYLCPNGTCEGAKNGKPLYYDDNHLSEYGNKLLVPMFEVIINNKKPN